jgi:hypothetical protein
MSLTRLAGVASAFAQRHRRASGRLSLALALAALASTPSWADKIAHPTAVFSGLDKITGRIISFEVATNETVQFGSLQITERACYTRPATEAPQTITFAQVDEIDAKKQYKRIFSGWMFASSPGLNGIEHPVYDVWLTDCKGGATLVKSEPDKTQPDTAQNEPPAAPTAADQEKQAKADQAAARADRKRRRAEAAAARRRAAEEAAERGPDPDMPMDTPQRDPNRAPPARSFFPDAAGGRDPGGGFY